MKIYARLIDNKIAEYPVYDIHIANRAHPLEWYTEVIFDDMPEVPAFHYAQEIVKVREGKVYVTYEIKPDALSSILHNLAPDSHLSPNETPVVDVTTVDQATIDRIIVLAKDHVQTILDDFAATRGYSNIVSAASYVTSTNPAFAAEAATAVALRDSTWTALYTYMAAVMAGTQPVPLKVADIEASLPELVW